MKHHDTNRRIMDETPRQRPDILDETHHDIHIVNLK